MYARWNVVRVLFSLLLLFASPLFGIGDDAQIVIRARSMVDLRSGRVVDAPVIVIEGELIKSISQGELPEEGRIIELGDLTLLPGLIEMHCHITDMVTGGEFLDPTRSTAADHALRGVAYARRTLLAGFTTVRNMGSLDFADVSLSRAIKEGYIIGPRIVPCGHLISITGGHGDAWGLAPGVLERDWCCGIADGPDEIVKAVRYQIKHGAKVIKILATAGVMTLEVGAGTQHMSEAEIRAAVGEANRHGLKVAAHAIGTEGIIAAVRAGVDSIEHGSILNDEAIALMKERGVYLVPTIYLSKVTEQLTLIPLQKSKAEKIVPRMRESLKKAIKAGIKIAFGTDAGVFPHGDNAKEFAVLVEHGLSPLEAIRAATINAADLLGVDDRGVLEPGKLADIIAVSGNPLEDIRTLEDVKFVVKGGVVYKREN